MKKLFIIDASNYIFRSYYAIRNMSNSKGVATNGLYGFIRSILKIQKDFSPDYFAVVFDGPRNKASRLAIYPDYKGHREKAPDDLYPQLGFAKDFCIANSLPVIEIDGVEADDAIGAVAKLAAKEGIVSYLCSSDKDLCQLVDEKTFIVHTHKNNAILDTKTVIDKYGITPGQFIDYLAIVGDSADNIPGIKGFGPKTAATLLQEFGTLEKLLENAHTLSNKKRAQKIADERDSAEVSYKLATIDVHLDIPKEISFYEIKEPEMETLAEFYEKMEFKTLLKELGSASPITPTVESLNGTYTLINDLSSLKGLVQSLKKEPSLCIATEVIGSHPMTAKLAGITLGCKKGVAYYICANGALTEDTIAEELRPLFNGSISFYAHDIKFVMHILAQHQLEITSIDFDTLIASYILQSHLMKHSLDLVIERYFGVKKVPLKSIIPKGRGNTFESIPLQEACNYCAENLDYTIRLKELFEQKIKDHGSCSLFYDIEMPLIPILFEMENSGIFLDSDYLSSYSKILCTKLETLSEKVYEEAGKEFNLNSPKQLSVILFTDLGIRSIKKTKDGHSTSADVLQALKNEHPIIPLILEYRTLEKLRSTYVDALPKEINENTGRIHCTFNQAGTVTGRLSSSNPNLQNIPVRGSEGIKVRKAFIPEKEGSVFLSLDYSQIELRILAHMSGETRLIEAFNDDKDIHVNTAALVFNVPIDQVTKEMRYQAKAVNFGLLYGQKAFGLSKELGLEIREAKRIIDTYFEKYPRVKSFIDEMMDKAKKEKKTLTLLGRERLLPDIDSKNFILRAANERIAINAPIQGTQSDIIKIAMINISKLLSDMDMKSILILQIHDELIFECPENEVEKCKSNVKIAMESAYSLLIPLKVDVSVGKNWSEC